MPICKSGWEIYTELVKAQLWITCS